MPKNLLSTFDVLGDLTISPDEIESSEPNNRLFILLAVALIGLICIGLLGLSGVLFAIQSNRAQEQAAVETAAVPPTPIPPTATPTSTATPTATITPEPTATSTPVINGETAAQEELIQPTEEPVEPEAEIEETELEETEPETEVVEEEETAEVEPVEVTPTNTRVIVADATSTETALAQDSTPSPPTEIIPSSGGVLPQANSNFLLVIAGILVVVLSVYGAIYRTR